MAVLERTVRIKVDTSGGKRKVDNLDKSVKKLGKDADQTNKSFGVLRASVVAVSAALVTSKIAQYSDAWKSVNNSLATAITETQSLATAQSDVVRIAQDARSPLEQVAKLYGGISAASSELNASQQDIAKFTELASKAIAVQGSSTSEAAGALLQLRQAIGGSVIQAQEFNSLIDGARPLLEAVAKGSDRFGGSVNKLREEVRKGTVTSKEFFEAALNGSEIIDKRFAKATVTLAQSFTLARNNAIKFVGTSEEITSVMDLAGDAVVGLSNNLDILVIAAATTASAYGAKLLTSLVITTAEKITATTASIALAKAEQSSAASALAVAKSEQSATVAMFNAASGATKASIAANQLTVANNRLATASTRAATANKVLAASSNIIARAGGGLALLGGPSGLVFLAVGAITAFALSASNAKSPTEQLADQVDALASSFGKLTAAQIAPKLANATNEVNNLESQLLSANEALKSLIQPTISGTLGSSSQIDSQLSKIRELESAIKLAIVQRDALFQAGLSAGRTPTSGESGISAPAETKDFDNTEIIKTETLRNELNERLALQRAFNNTVVSDQASLFEQQRANTEFNRQADLAALTRAEEDSALNFERKRDSLLTNQKLDAEAKLLLGAELQSQELIQKQIFETELTEIEAVAAEERKLITQDETETRAELNQRAADIMRQSNELSVNAVLGFLQQFAGKSKALAIGLVALRAAEGISSAIINSQVAATRALAELGPIAGAGPAAAMLAFGKISAGIIAANSVLKLGGGSGSSGGGGIGSAGGSSSAQPQRQEPIQQSNVIEFRGLSEVAEELRNLDPDEVLPVEFVQRIVSSLGEFDRISGGQP